MPETPKSPYVGLAPSAFWKSGCAEAPPTETSGLYKKRFRISRDARIAAAGSCFAQHITARLKARDYTILDLEPPPSGLSTDQAKEYGYNLYSARYGNIYVVRQLLQLLREALGEHTPADAIWEKNGRYYDALRPNVEPKGLSSPEEVIAHREAHLAAVRDLLSQTDLMVFTFGLTEAWVDRKSGTVYPTAPGTIAGRYDPERHVFKNFTFSEIYKDFLAVRDILRRFNRRIKFVVTVSPVPLTATASDEHVLAATIYSKSVLRAVAGQLKQNFNDIDYFPSYELIASHYSRGMFYENNLRSVSNLGVDTAMRLFLQEHGADAPAQKRSRPAKAKRDAAARKEDVVCEDMLLEAFAQ